MSTQNTTHYLQARGWRRSDLTKDELGECGASGETTGWCERAARWSKPFRPGPMCAQHAAQVERYYAATTT